MARDQIGRRWARPLVRHVQQVDPGALPQELDAEMRPAADARRRESDGAGLGLGERNEFLRSLGRKRRRHHHDERVFGEQRHRREVGLAVGQLLVHRRIDRLGRDHEPERQSVRLGLGDHVGAEHAVRAGAVVDDHRLLPEFVEPLADQPRDGVGAAAGCVRHHNPHRAGWIALRLREGRREQQAEDHSKTKHAYGSSVVMPSWRAQCFSVRIAHSRACSR